MSGEEVQLSQSNDELNLSKSTENSNGVALHGNGAGHSKHNGLNGNVGPKPINVVKSGLCYKRLVFDLVVGFLVLATSTYLVVEYKDDQVPAVIEATFSKEVAQVLIHHINDDLAPMVESIKANIRDGIQKVMGQGLAVMEGGVEKSKYLNREESGSNMKKEVKVETERKREAEEDLKKDAKKEVKNEMEGGVEKSQDLNRDESGSNIEKEEKVETESKREAEEELKKDEKKEDIVKREEVLEQNKDNVKTVEGPMKQDNVEE